MKDRQNIGYNKKSAVLTMTGAAIMILLTATKIMPTSNIAGYSVFVGIAFFFIVEAAVKTPNSESGLRFNTIAEDIKRPGVIVWALLPIVSGIASLTAGNMIFGGEFAAHVRKRS